MRKIEMLGKQYHRLTVTREVGRYVEATCECGFSKKYYRGNVLAGYTKSCGCFRDEQIREANTSHGHRIDYSSTRTYESWRSMKRRCNNPLNDNYQWYGGRGITYAERWYDFNNFLQDMGERPEGMELDRIDNQGNYSKENCRWITHQENCRNR